MVRSISDFLMQNKKKAYFVFLLGVILIVWNWEHVEEQAKVSSLVSGNQKREEHVALGTSFASGGSEFVAKKVRTFSGGLRFAKALEERSDYGRVQNNDCEFWAVITTIFKPTLVMKQIASLKEWCLVIIADLKSPAGFEAILANDGDSLLIEEGLSSSRIVYLTPEKQRKLPYKMLKHVSWNHFGRKNIGYLYAIHHGAKLIYDTDDDNFLQNGKLPLNDLLQGMSFKETSPSFKKVWKTIELNENTGNYNPYRSSFKATSEGGEIVNAWPRGFPLSEIKQTDTYQVKELNLEGHQVSILQSLANNDPDVDAIYRLTSPLPINFVEGGEGLGRVDVVPNGVFMSFNAQALMFSDLAFWATMLPATVHGRVSDIWRAYIAQRIMWDLGQNVAVSAPFVVQCRNVHSYLGDFSSENHLYTRTSALQRFLRKWDSDKKTLVGRIEKLYVDLYEHSFLEKEDVFLVQEYLTDLVRVGYNFPTPWKVAKYDDQVKQQIAIAETNCEEKNLHDPSHSPDKKAILKYQSEDSTCEIVAGILSHSANEALRQAIRDSWLSSVPDFVCIFFLIDKPTEKVQVEKKKQGDILYINSQFTGRANHFGEKLYKWLSLAHELFPNAKAIVKMDDDVYMCPQRVFDDVRSRLTPLLYFGFLHESTHTRKIGKVRRIDEAFVALGSELVKRIVNRPYCPDDNCPDNSLVDTNYGGTSLGIWLQHYSDLNLQPSKKIRLLAPDDNMPVPNCLVSELYLWNRLKTKEDFQKFHNYQKENIGLGSP